ncbi:MAG: hypothetical protein V4562_09595 [Pseudomonadota bacterium]
MRHLLLALLVALLPLRGWVGDAMATGMLAQQLSAIQNVAINSDSAPASGLLEHKKQPKMADCPGHPAAADSTETGGSDSTQHNCTACNLCHSVVFTPLFATLLPAALPTAPPYAGTHSFTSAVAAAGFKPPIS